MKAGRMTMPQEGLADLDSALGLDPKNYDALLLRGEILTRMQRFDASIADINYALDVAHSREDSIKALSHRGAALYRNRRFREAQRDYDLVLAIDSLYEDALLGKSNLLRDLGHEEAALDILHRLHELKPKNKKYLNNMAFALAALGRFDEAVNAYDQGVALFPDDGTLLSNRAYARMKMGDLQGAYDDIQHSLDIFPGNSYAYRNLGLIEHARGNKPAACNAWQKATELNFTPRFGTEVEELLKEHCR